MVNTTDIFGGQTGAALGKQGTTVQTFAISLAAGAVLFLVQFTFFLLARNYLWAKRIYQPRSFLIPLKSRIKPPPSNPFRWIYTVFKIKEDPEVLYKAGMDAYFFLRYLSMNLKIFTPALCLILPILLPLNYHGGVGGQTINGVHYDVKGLDTLAWGNVSPDNTNRYWAHCILAIILIVWVCYVFHQELMHYVIKRQEYLTSSGHRLKASSTTVLVTDIPKEMCTTEALDELYGDFPGGVRRIWLNRDFGHLLEKDVERRENEVHLERAETNMLRKIAKRNRKLQKAGKRESSATITGGGCELSETEMKSSEQATVSPALIEEIRTMSAKEACERCLQYDQDTKATWTHYLGPGQRPRMWICDTKHTWAWHIPIFFRFFSTKVDTIYYCRRELARLNDEVESAGQTFDTYKKNGSAFIQFNTQKAAHLACQAVADVNPRKMTSRSVEISPADINWASLSLTWKARYVHRVVFFFLFLVAILVFGIISFITGSLSSASTFGDSITWLSWIGKLPPWLLSFVQGTLPPVIQVILLSGPLPIVLRSMTNKTRGALTESEGERSLQLWYFIFLLIELFIIPTLSSGLLATIQDLIQSPGNVTTILAKNLPTASNYYFSFLIVQALSISASSITQTIRLFNFYVLGGTNTPDSVFAKLSFTNRTRIGSNIPWYTTFAVIGLAYSVIAPLILVFMIITFSLFWTVIKNNILYVIRTGDVDGGGLFFPSAINQTFTGLYFLEICLLGLFFLVRDENGKVALQAQGIIMAIVLMLTICYQIWLNLNFHALYQYAPIRLEVEVGRRQREAEEAERLIAEKNEAIAQSDGDTSDTTSRPTTAELNASWQEGDKAAAEEPSSKRPAAARMASKQSLRRPRSTTLTEEIQRRKDAAEAKRILVKINRPLDESHLASMEARLSRAQHSAGHIGHSLLPRKQDIEKQMYNDPISKIIMQHNDEIEDLDADDRDLLISVAFTHPILREPPPAVWIPNDDLGVSDDEVRRTRAMWPGVGIENRGAFFNQKLKVEVDKPPPDMSEFALIMAEL
ncbi:DUF221-domain-containing protein [Venturia nashicola]|uniref:DUF221-domain-containing protein n=1 Tax=Venturia nashicola TaxID=86259 RepID=A0A4Z1PP71_9PEZI|nr:DUF221-domain-containing protein [Venturia nashicola]TLD36955.1 DUF221-domain-containing protein [Venturia nashicola]